MVQWIKLSLYFLFMIFSHSAHATRTVSGIIGGGEYGYIFLANPSTVSQTVTATFQATGVCTIAIDSSHVQTAWDSVTCTSSTRCTNNSGYLNISAGGNLILGIKIGGCTGGAGLANSLVNYTVSTPSNTGYLTGSVSWQGWGYYAVTAINGGRPF